METDRVSSVAQMIICLPCRTPRFNPWVRRSSGEVNAYPLQCSCLENSTDRGAWQATVHGVAENRTELKTHNTWKWTLLQTPAVDLRVFAGTHWSCIPAVMRTDTLFLLAVGICHDMSS